MYYKGNLHSQTSVEKEFIEDDDESEMENSENPFRKEFVTSDADSTKIHRSFENLSGAKIPIIKPIFKSTGSLIDRPKIAPPARPPQPNIKTAEMVRNSGLELMSRQMEQKDFLEFVHNAETNTVEEFDPDDPLPPLPKCPPPQLLTYKRVNSVERPKNSPPPPPPPKNPVPTSEILEILPARFDTFPMKQKPHFVNENSQNNILVSEDEHREILLTENELRNAIMTAEYDDSRADKTAMLIRSFSSTNPFLDDALSSSSLQSTPSILSPVSTLDKSSTSSFGQYHVPTINNIYPPPAQVLPVHYGQLPKPQQAGYYPLMSHQYYHTPPSTGIQVASEYRQQQQGYLVSGDGQSNFYVNVNNTANNQQQTLLMQSAFEPLSQPSPPYQASSHHLHMQASNSQYVATPPPNNFRPQFIYDRQLQQQPQYYGNTVQYVAEQQQQYQSRIVEAELSPIRINQVPQNFVYTENSQEQKPSMSSFGKQTEV